MPTEPTLPGVAPAADSIVRADGTWFDLSPGVLSARRGDDGFTLGLDPSNEKAVLSPGDYVQIQQNVDLTNQDLVETVATVTGVEVNSGENLPGLQVLADTLLLYRMNEASEGALEESNWRYDLRPVDGVVDFGAVTYGHQLGLLRDWPVSPSVNGSLVGLNNPNVIPSAGLIDFTMDWWQNFDVDSIADSPGIDPVIFQLRSVTGGGIKVWWKGSSVPTSHQWDLTIDIWNSGVRTSYPIGNTRTTNQGWEFFTMSLNSAASKVTVYKNGAGVSSAIISGIPTQPLVNSSIIVGHPDYRGQIDDVRLSNTEHDLTQHQADYDTRNGTASTINAEWRLKSIIDGEVHGEVPIPEDGISRETLIQSPVKLETGTKDIAVRLELEEI